jgi:hypothetical protein
MALRGEVGFPAESSAMVLCGDASFANAKL